MVVAVAFVCYIAVFVGVAALMEILLDRVPTTGELAVVGGLAALALPPLTRVLRGVVDELLFGARSGPLEAAQALDKNRSDVARCDGSNDAAHGFWSVLA